jgi:hypothetical protein
MNRRDFVKNASAAAVGLASPLVSDAKADTAELIEIDFPVISFSKTIKGKFTNLYSVQTKELFCIGSNETKCLALASAFNLLVPELFEDIEVNCSVLNCSSASLTFSQTETVSRHEFAFINAKIRTTKSIYNRMLARARVHKSGSLTFICDQNGCKPTK